MNCRGAFFKNILKGFNAISSGLTVLLKSPSQV